MTPDQRNRLSQLRRKGFGLPSARDLADAMERQGEPLPKLEPLPDVQDTPLTVALTLLAIVLVILAGILL